MCILGVYLGKDTYSYSFPDGHPMNSKRIECFQRLLESQGLMMHKEVKVIPPPLADEESILSFHTLEYVKFVKMASERGHGYLDYGDTPAYPKIFEATCYVVGAVVDALHRVMSKEFLHAFIPMAGLHHARKASAAGFCVFNDIAIAIVQAERIYRLKRILYVDIDAHHGDGVLYEFYDDPKVYIADIHEDGRYLYPGTGHPHETGSGNAVGTKLNIPLPPMAGDEAFEEAFGKVLNFAKDVKPELVIFQCGADGLAGDPLTHLRYTTKTHELATRSLHLLAHEFCDGKLIVMGGGGYNPEKTAEAWLVVVKTLLENP